MLATHGPYCPSIHSAGDRPRPMPWSLPQRRLTHYLMVTSLDGEEQIRVDGVDHVIARGRTYIIAPGLLADLGSSVGNVPVWVHFDVMYHPQRGEHPPPAAYKTDLGGRSDLLQPQPREIWGIDLPVVVADDLAPIMAEGVPNLVRCWQEDHPLAQFQANQLLATLLATLVASAYQRQGQGKAADPASRIARAEALARQHLDTDFGVGDFAATAGYSRSRFGLIYHQLRGLTPGAFLRRERMGLAQRLLRRPDLPIARVGTMVGYPDPTAFGRAFRARFGHSPGHWRGQLHGGASEDLPEPTGSPGRKGLPGEGRDGDGAPVDRRL